MVLLGTILPILCVGFDLVFTASVNPPNDDMDYIADRISVKDELMLEDEKLALAHIDMDIRDFEDLEKTIFELRLQIQKHANEHIVDQKDLVHAYKARENDYDPKDSFE